MMPKSFSAKFALAFGLGLLAAVGVAPFAAATVAWMGFRFPMPRIFDRVVMVTLGLVLILFARRLRLLELLRRGFAHPGAGQRGSLRGLCVSLAVMTLLLITAIALSGAARPGRSVIRIFPWSRMPNYILSALVIAVIEEGFFRAFLLAGMISDFGRTTAVLASSAIYALAHLVRSPARFYVTGFDPMAGLHTLALSFNQIADPGSALPTFVGLLLLGIVLAEAFLITGTVWFSLGLHAGLVLGSKVWPKILVARADVPGWLAGWGHQPVISGAAAWAAAILILMWLRPLAGIDRRKAV